MVVSLFILLGRGAVEARIPIRYQKFKGLILQLRLALSLSTLSPYPWQLILSPCTISSHHSNPAHSHPKPATPTPTSRPSPPHVQKALHLTSPFQSSPKAHLSPARPAIQRPPSPRPPATPTPNQRRGRLAASGAPRCQIRAGWRGCEMLSSEQELGLRGGGGVDVRWRSRRRVVGRWGCAGRAEW